jgi:GTP-binding protein HflX
LIGVGMDGRADDAELPVFDELAELARTAGARVVLRFYQRKANPESSSYLGSGKMQELAKEVKDTGATLVIADDDLSPAQVRHLEEATCVRVIDRSELIIDIFARAGRTEQAKLQVELAQLQYLSPRLKRMWTHLSRITGAGGIGSRGPGEKQIEVDRRLVGRRRSRI